MIHGQSKQKHYLVYTYGCQMNEHDSERMASQLESLGYTATDNKENADIILINTCCVRESAENKIYGKIGELKRLKQLKPNLLIGISGCMAQKDRDNLLKKAPHIDFVIGTHNVQNLGSIISNLKNSGQPLVEVWDKAQQSEIAVSTVRKNSISAWVPIMYGCNNFCTYCIVPYVRGREWSRPPSEIIDEIKQLGAAGYKEITLLGQNVNSYGKDNQEYGDFADLLSLVDTVSGIERVRYMTSHPRDMNDKVINIIKESNKICEHFHLPVQAGSDKLLAVMNRGYNTAYYYNLISKIRQAIPHASITTDIIVGFPGETEELFNETLEFIRTIHFDVAFTFLYSRRSGTPAAEMTDQVTDEEKKDRLNRLMEVQNEISLELNKQLEQKTVEVLVEGESKNDSSKLTGRTRTNKIVLWDKKDNQEPGQLANIKVTNAQTWVLKGQVE